MSLNVKDNKDLESKIKDEDLSCNKNDISENSHVESKKISQIDISQKKEYPRIQIRDSIISEMFREIYFLILIVLAYAALQNSTPKVSKSPKAYPFFPEGSLVKDYFNGDLSEAIEYASQSDLAFVMYYAPWDAESQNVKHEFNLAAQHMSTRIHFAAINCWQPNSECRQQYSKVYTWPVLMAYPTHGRGIQYRGIKKYEFMIKFLQLVMNPVMRISLFTEISEYQASHDAVVVCFVDARVGSSDYGVFYTAALRFLETDPFGEVQFLVYSTKLELPMIHLYLWNETVRYPYDSEWKPETIITWINDHLHQVSVWETLPGSKSTTLANYLTPGPTLVLFTPRNPLYTHIDYYSVLREIGLDYYNCEDNIGIKVQKSFLNLLRKDYFNHYKALESKCLPTKKFKKHNFPTVITYDFNKLWMNNSCTSKKLLPAQDFCFGKNVIKNTCSNIVTTSKIKLNVVENKNHDNNLEEVIKKVYTNSYTDEDDIRSPKNLQKLRELDECYYFRLAHKIDKAYFADLNNEMDLNITGLACKTNISLSVLALDSAEYYHFAENLGIDILNNSDKTALVIFNPKLETFHVMHNKFSRTNIEHFIIDFTNGKLDRSLNSEIKIRPFTHFYEFQGSHSYHNTTQKIQTIEELFTYNFLPTIMQPNQALILMYYSTKCGFCSGVSHMLLETSKILSNIRELKFARIDGDKQSLPWEFSMHHFPSILYFPPKRKSESRVFPQNVAITVPNLLAFILANVDSNIKLKVMWKICNQTQFNEDMQMCIKVIRNESMTLIGKLLRLYRFTHDVTHRTLVLKQLQNTRSLYFALTKKSINVHEINKFINLLKNIDMKPNKLREL